jgi:hypothetical protein
MMKAGVPKCIPFRSSDSLEANTGSGQLTARFIHRKNESAWLQMVPKNESGTASRMIDLDGIEGLEAHKHLDLMPYVVGRSEFIEPSSPNNPFNDGSRQFGTTGLDIKYGISSNFTLDATVNPDFGQVEVDPAVVNQRI